MSQHRTLAETLGLRIAHGQVRSHGHAEITGRILRIPYGTARAVWNGMIITNPLNTIRWARKASDWAAPTVTSPDVLTEANNLPIFPAMDNPLDDAAGRPQFYVAVLIDGRRFLVNTEGYEYARYIAALPNIPKE